MFNTKKIVVVLIFTFIGINLFAQESGLTYKPLFSGGGATGMFNLDGAYAVGGYGEYAFTFYEDGFQISNHIIGSGGNITSKFGNKYGTGSIIEKISLGGFFAK
jgi:hypothetical protein